MFYAVKYLKFLNNIFLYLLKTKTTTILTDTM